MDKKTKIYLILPILLGIRLGVQLLVMNYDHHPTREEIPGIAINGNAALDAFCAGNGTNGLSWETAHQIKGESIYCNPVGMTLENIDRYTIIRNCTISSSYYRSYSSTHYCCGTCYANNFGIFLNNCTHVKIIDCQIEYWYVGIFLASSNDTSVMDNSIVDAFEVGISLCHSNNNTIEGNQFIYCDYGAIDGNYADNNTIAGNRVTHGYYSFPSVTLSHSGNNTVCNNTDLELSLKSAYNNTLSNNSVPQITLEYAGNNTLSGNIVDTTFGIMLKGAANNTFTENTATKIVLTSAQGNIFSGNTLQWGGFALDGSSRNNSIDATNNVNAMPVLYFENQSGLTIANLATLGQLILVHCNDSVVANLTASNVYVGIICSWGFNNTISNVTVTNNTWAGITIYATINTTLLGIDASDCDTGISVSYATNTTIEEGRMSHNDNGIELVRSVNTTISSNNASYNNLGIYGSSSNGTRVWNNTLASNNEGIYLSFMRNSIIANNSASSIFADVSMYDADENYLSANDLSGTGISLEYSTNNVIDITNRVHGKPVYYFEGEKGGELKNPGGVGQVIAINCSDLAFAQFQVSGVENGILIDSCDNVSIEACNVSNNDVGIQLRNSNNSNILGNIADGNDIGIELIDAAKNIITNNEVTGNSHEGIYLKEAMNNTVMENNASFNRNYGIHCWASDFNIFSGNNVSHNGASGIDLSYSHNNSITNNNASYNDNKGINLDYSRDNVVTGNVAWYNRRGCIVEHGSDGSNEIRDNNCDAPIDWPIVEIIFILGAVALATTLYFLQKSGSQKTHAGARELAEMPSPGQPMAPAPGLGSITFHGTKYTPTIKKGKLTLDLSSNGIADIGELQGLEKLVDLQVLNLDENKITKITHLALPNLRELSLSGNQITEIAGLDHLPNLRVLDLSDNQISEITNLDHVLRLRELKLLANRITVLQGLGDLRSLKVLWLEGNPLYAWAKRFYGSWSIRGGAIGRLRPMIDYCRNIDKIQTRTKGWAENGQIKIVVACLVSAMFGIFFLIDLFLQSQVGMAWSIFFIFVDALGCLEAIVLGAAIKRLMVFYAATKPQWDALAAKKQQAT